MLLVLFFYVSPLLRTPFYSPLSSLFCCYPPTLSASECFCSVSREGRCWVSSDEQIWIPEHLLALSVHLSSESPLSHIHTLALWSWTGNIEVCVLHTAVFKSQILALPNVIWELLLLSLAQFIFSEGFDVQCHPLVSEGATAGCGVTGFMTELGAPCWSCCCAYFIELHWYLFFKGRYCYKISYL